MPQMRNGRRRGRAPARSNGGGKLSIPTDPTRLALFFLIMVSIARVHQLFPFLQVFRPGLLALAVALGYSIFDAKAVDWRRTMSSWPAVVLLAYAATTIASSFGGISLGASASFLMDNFSKTVVAMIILIAAVRSIRELWFFVWAYVVSLILWIYMAFFVFETSTMGSATARLGDLYTYDANDLGVILVSGLPLTMALLAAGGRLQRLILVGAIVGNIVTIALTGSRGAMVGIAVVGLFLFVTANQFAWWKRIGVAAALVGALIVAAPPGYWTQMSTILNPEDDYNVTDIDGRLPIAKRGFGYFLDRPVLGIGPQNFGRAEINNPEKRMLLPPGAPLRNIAPHNTYVQVISELGGVGIVIWMFMLFKGIVHPLQLRKRMPKSWAKGDPEERLLYSMSYFFPVAWLGFAATSTFVSFAYVPPPFVLLALAAGFTDLAQRRLARHQREQHRARVARHGGVPGHLQAGPG